jgi:hypothetical protein
MAGKKQHDLPQLLLRGFAEVEGETEFVWLFRKNTEPKRVSILDVRPSKLFYDKPGPGTLDDFITHKENEYGALVAQLRRERRLRPSDEETLIEFVHSLVLRTRNLRDLLSDAFGAMLGELASAVTDADAARQQLLKEQEKNSAMWDQALTGYVRAKYGIRNRLCEAFLKWWENKDFKHWLTHSAQAKEHIQQQVILNEAQLASLGGQIGAVMKKSHNDQLIKVLQSRGDAPTRRYLRYRQLRWKIQSLERGSLILGDVAVLQFERQTGKFSPAFDGDKGEVILLPLSHDLLVIGTEEDIGAPLSISELNRASAQLSFHYFISLKNSEREQEYQQLLGSGLLRAPKILVS